MKLSDWLREEAAFSGLGEYAQAADLLDECEKALLEISDATAGSEHPTCISVGILSRATLARLRGEPPAQGKADD